MKTTERWNLPSPNVAKWNSERAQALATTEYKPRKAVRRLTRPKRNLEVNCEYDRGEPTTRPRTNSEYKRRIPINQVEINCE